MSSPSNTLRRSRKAFTLIDLIIAIGLMAVLAAIAVPALTGAKETQVIAAAQRLATDLQYAQNHAITSRQPVTVTFDVMDDSYALSNASGVVIHPMNKTDYEVAYALTADLPDVQVLSASFGGAAQVTFDVMGSPDSAGTVRIQSGGQALTVAVADVTGLVTISD